MNIKNLLFIGLALFNSACSTRILEPAMDLTLIDKVTKKSLSNAMNTKNILLNKSSKLILEKVTVKELPLPLGVHYISSIIAIAPKGYQAQWCLCHILNTSYRTCKARVVAFTPQKSSKEMTEEALTTWLEKKSTNIHLLAKVLRKYNDPNPTQIFCSEDPLSIKR